MAIVDLVMPKMGESIMEATILKWHKQPGDVIKQDETVLEIATDKVDSEVPAATAGILSEILYQVNDVVPVGAVIARIKTEAADAAPAKPGSPSNGETPQKAAPAERRPEPAYQESYTQNGNGSQMSSNGNRFYSPLVLNIAASEGVPLSELEHIPGTGNEGRVTKKDILQYVATRKQGNYQGANRQTMVPPTTRQQAVAQPAAVAAEPANEQVREAAQSPSTTSVSYTGAAEIQEMDRMRRLIADHMVRSKQTSPHVTSFTEADVTHMVQWREKVKGEFEKREGAKLTFTPIFIEAIVRCIKKHPLINCSLEGTKIIIKKDINLGMATALPSGNLIVPVIRNADQYNLVGLAKQVNTMAENARNNKLKPEDTQNGTFTMTNVGVFGSLMGTPIINQPQVAILALGAIKKRPVVLESAEGDSIGIRHMMYLSLSYDHRIVDGSLGATFLSDVAKELERFDASRSF